MVPRRRRCTVETAARHSCSRYSDHEDDLQGSTFHTEHGSHPPGDSNDRIDQDSLTIWVSIDIN